MPSIAAVAAEIHRHMCTCPKHGYTQGGARWGQGPNSPCYVEVLGHTYEIPGNDFDCSSSVKKAWELALQGTDYEGVLGYNGYDRHGNWMSWYTGNERDLFVGSGLFTWEPMSFTADTGDMYLSEANHVAMCQTQVPDVLSEFLSNEWGGITGGQVGDQTGGESVVRAFWWPSFGWDGILHYNGKADGSRVPRQDPGKAVNDAGLLYRAHVQDAGWLDAVHDGQTAGTVGYGARLEAIKITPPDGWELRVKAHVQNVGWKTYPGIRKGESSGEGSSANDPIIGSVGKSQRIEDLIVEATKRPEGDKRKLYFQVHQADVGWKSWTEEGYASGTDGMGVQLEAIRMKLV